MTEVAAFVCSICGETSFEICVYCTKDACANHRCARCGRCSDCCECEVPLEAVERREAAAPHLPPGEPEPLPPAQPEPLPQYEPEPPPHTEPEPLGPTVPEPVPGTEPQPETPGPTAFADRSGEADKARAWADELPDSQAELIKALPQLFAPDPEPAVAEASEVPDMNIPRSEVLEEEDPEPLEEPD